MSFGDNLGQLVEASNAELGGGDLEAVPGVGAHCTKLRADLVDGDRPAAPPLLIGVADEVALGLVPDHVEGVGEDRWAAHIEDGDVPELVLSSHLRVANVAKLLDLDGLELLSELVITGVAEDRAAVEVVVVVVVELGERDGSRRPCSGGG